MSHYESIKSIDIDTINIDTKSKQNRKLSTRYTAADKHVWRYCNNSY